jgi:hypothetical protein
MGHQSIHETKRHTHSCRRRQTVCGVSVDLRKNIRMANVYGTETWQQLEKQLRVIGTVFINVS